MNNVAVASAATSPVTVSLNDWIKASSTKLHSDNSNQQSFVTNAVDLAWMLTRHLRRIVDHLIDETKLQEINAGNVIVFVDPPSSHNRLSVKDVKIILTRTVWGGGVHAEQYGKGTASRAAPPPPHAICAALGKILLYIFSWGQSSALSLPLSLEAAEVETISSSSDLLSNKNEANNYDNGPFSLEGSPLEINSSDAQNDYLEERIMKPPSAKRNATMPARRDGSAASKAANTLLLDVGMPLSICRLVGDLLNATTSNEMEPCCTLEEALWDLSYMKTSPNLYLFDRTCPQQALEDACLFRGNGRHLFGRKNEMRALFAAKNKISSHLTSSENNEPEHATTLVSSPRNLISPNDFLCKAVFLQGYAGAGKSSLIHSVVEACEEEKWFILECKFDKEKRMDISSAFNDFFGKCHETLENNPNSPLAQQFSKICCSISAAFDATGLHQLCNLIPNLKHAFPDSLRLSLPRGKGHGQRDVSSMDKVGSGDERRFHMLRLLLRSLCSVGRPVLLTLDDLQWARLFSVEFMGGFIEFMHASSGSTGRYSRQGGLLIVGAYRSNEVEADGDLLKRINSMKQSDKENVVTLNVGEMTKIEINKLISSKLCLPMRYTKNLSDLAHAKTGGNAFFIIEFLWSIIQNKCLQFSVRSRRWEWDVETISMSTISDGVAELLLESFSQLPSRVKQLIKIISCLGYQVEEWLIDALDYNNQILSFNMKNELVIAVQENFLEKAGPVWQFTHDIVKSTIYELIPAKNRALLHKNIGDILLTNSQHFPSESKAIQKMATDQINKYCQCGHLDKHNRSLFASQNVMAAKSALTSYNFEEAQSYIDSAIKLLEIDHWETQYSLSLELFEMSASISCMHGDIDKMSSCLDNILSHAKEFNDTLKASSLLVKLLAASTKFEEAISNCLVILENLGEHFANDVSPSEAARELSVVTETLLNNNVTCEQFKLLPLMTDKRKINAMKFMNMACQYSLVSRPMLLPLLCCRMLRLTIKYGFCDDSIVGLATVGYSSFTLTENTRLGSQIAKVCETMIRESLNEHVLRSRLCIELVMFLIYTQPAAAVMTQFPVMYESSKLAGDMENAVVARRICCAFVFWFGSGDLLNLSKHIVMCIDEASKYRQIASVNFLMVHLNACIYLTGETNAKLDTKSFNELKEIGKTTKSNLLLWQCHVCEICGHFYMRDYLAVVSLCETNPCPRPKRILHGWRTFFEGVACLSLARDTKKNAWRRTGENAVSELSKWAIMSPWNFESKYKLLQAELSYLDGELEPAENSYKASIISAQEHKSMNDEAIACELYGIYLVENKRAGAGLTHLLKAVEKYKDWGAVEKFQELQGFIDITINK